MGEPSRPSAPRGSLDVAVSSAFANCFGPGLPGRIVVTVRRSPQGLAQAGESGLAPREVGGEELHGLGVRRGLGAFNVKV
jgi:hypothetical protein